MTTHMNTTLLTERKTAAAMHRSASNVSPGPVRGCAAIRVENLSLEYNGKPAFTGVSMAFTQNRITAIIGPSGCGKTSFLTCLNRLTDLVPRCRVTGRVTIGQTEVYAPETDAVSLRRRVGMIFQKPSPFPLSIRKNIELPLRDHGVRKKKHLEQTVETALRDVGLWSEVKDRLNSPATTLSGGQQQRLCLARALALEPEVLLLDEPCSSLDPVSSGVVEDLIVSLSGRFTIVMVTHNLAQAKRIAHDVAVFWMHDNAGQLIETGPCGDVFNNPSQPITAAYINGSRG